MRRLALLTLCATVALGGCGGDRSDSTATTSQPNNEGAASGPPDMTLRSADSSRFIGKSGTAVATACELIDPGTVERIVGRVNGSGAKPLERTANNSRDLSLCEYRERSGPEVYTRVSLDTATRAVRRYFNLITEARQLPSVIPSGPGSLELVRGLGDDGTYGGAGAFWIGDRLELTAIHDERIVRTHVYVKGARTDDEKRAAISLARLAFAGYAREARKH